MKKNKLKFCDNCIVLLILVISILVYFKISPSEKKSPLLREFPVPNKIIPYNKIPGKNLLSKLKKKNSDSESLFISACAHLEKKEYDLSTHFINQALALAPGEKKYHRLKNLISVKKSNLEAFQRVQQLLNNHEYSKSWSFFKSCCSNNYVFFSEYGNLYADLLKKKNCIASSDLLISALVKSGVTDG